MKREQELVKNSAILSLGTIVPKLATLLTTPIITGYLTKAIPGQMPSSSGNISLKIPNKEVYQIYVDSVRSWFRKILRGKNRDELLDAFWSGNGEKNISHCDS